MSAFKGTKGPWRVVAPEERFIIPAFVFSQSDEQVCGLAVLGDGIERADEERANANLIAAAPRMLLVLDACETALSPLMASHECFDKPDGKDRCEECMGCVNWATWQMARDAIAAALGEVQP